ncbi:MAG TPA: DUF2723 domain-containing protein [bacterium]|nr:DUF2723 domain-containing protein [bacterium]
MISYFLWGLSQDLLPTVYIGDSGELIAVAYTLGIPHPPGYPLLSSGKTQARLRNL